MVSIGGGLMVEVSWFDVDWSGRPAYTLEARCSGLGDASCEVQLTFYAADGMPLCSDATHVEDVKVRAGRVTASGPLYALEHAPERPASVRIRVIRWDEARAELVGRLVPELGGRSRFEGVALGSVGSVEGWAAHQTSGSRAAWGLAATLLVANRGAHPMTVRTRTVVRQGAFEDDVVRDGTVPPGSVGVVDGGDADLPELGSAAEIRVEVLARRYADGWDVPGLLPIPYVGVEREAEARGPFALLGVEATVQGDRLSVVVRGRCPGALGAGVDPAMEVIVMDTQGDAFGAIALRRLSEADGVLTAEGRGRMPTIPAPPWRARVDLVLRQVASCQLAAMIEPGPAVRARLDDLPALGDGVDVEAAWLVSRADPDEIQPLVVLRNRTERAVEVDVRTRCEGPEVVKGAVSGVELQPGSRVVSTLSGVDLPLDPSPSRFVVDLVANTEVARWSAGPVDVA